MRETLYPRICLINDSTNLIGISYDPIDQEMMAVFKEGIKYIYHNVTNKTFAAIISADSVGTVFNKLVKAEGLLGVKVDE
jgi:hypothetical protein